MMKTIYSPAYRRLVAQLCRHRAGKGLRQEDVARRLGFTRHWISKVESCQLRLDVVQLVRICRVYNVSAWPLARRLEKELSEEDAPFTYQSTRSYRSGVRARMSTTRTAVRIPLQTLEGIGCTFRELYLHDRNRFSNNALSDQRNVPGVPEHRSRIESSSADGEALEHRRIDEADEVGVDRADKGDTVKPSSRRHLYGRVDCGFVRRVNGVALTHLPPEALFCQFWRVCFASFDAVPKVSRSGPETVPRQMYRYKLLMTGGLRKHLSGAGRQLERATGIEPV